jgi:hypothetical protein
LELKKKHLQPIVEGFNEILKKEEILLNHHHRKRNIKAIFRKVNIFKAKTMGFLFRQKLKKFLKI